MRDVTLLTKKPFDYGSVHNLIIAEFKEYEIVVDNPNEGNGRIFLCEGKRIIDIDFTPSDTMSAFQYEFEEEQLTQFPFEVYLTCVLFRCGEAILKLVKALLAAGIEFWIHDEDGEIVTPQSFVPHPDAPGSSTNI